MEKSGFVLNKFDLQVDLYVDMLEWPEPCGRHLYLTRLHKAYGIEKVELEISRLIEYRKQRNGKSWTEVSSRRRASSQQADNGTSEVHQEPVPTRELL